MVQKEIFFLHQLLIRFLRSKYSAMDSLPEDKKKILTKDLNARVKNAVKIIMFTQEHECKFCSDTRNLVEEIGALNDKISVQIYDFVKNKDVAKEYKIDKMKDENQKIIEKSLRRRKRKEEKKKRK